MEDKQGEFDEMQFCLGGMTLNFLDVIAKQIDESGHSEIPQDTS